MGLVAGLQVPGLNPGLKAGINGLFGGATPLVDFDFSAPLTSWKTGFTGFQSAYATDEWLLQETSGSHANNKGTATLSNSGGLQGQTAVGLWDGSSYVARKAWETDGTSDVLTCSDAVAGDSDGVDFAGRIVFRGSGEDWTNARMFSKRDAGAGWLLYENSTKLKLYISDGTNSQQVQLAANVSSYRDGGWHWIAFWYDASADLMYIKSDLDSEASISSAGVTGSLTNAQALRVSQGAASGAKGLQVTYAGVCVGANAQAMYDEDFWQHAQDPTGLLTTATRACLISVPVAAGYVGHFSEDQLPIGYHSAFSDANKLGLYCNSAQTNYAPYSEDFTQWTNQNTTDSANAADSPDGFRTATQLTASVDDGAIYRNCAIISPNTQYTLSAWVKRVGGSDVTGRIRLRDTTAATETSQNFTATDTWQRVQVSHTMGGAGVNGRNYIHIDTTGESIYIWGVQTEEGSGTGAYIRTTAASASLVNCNYERATEDCIASAEGEILANFVWPIYNGNSDRYVYSQAAAVLAETRILYMNSAERIAYVMRQGGTLEDSGFFSATHNPVPKDQEITIAYQWGASLETPEVRFIIDGNIEDGTAEQPYEETAGSDYEGLQVGSSQSATNSFDGFIQRIVTYDQLVTEGV